MGKLTVSAGPKTSDSRPPFVIGIDLGTTNSLMAIAGFEDSTKRLPPVQGSGEFQSSLSEFIPVRVLQLPQRNLDGTLASHDLFPSVVFQESAESERFVGMGAREAKFAFRRGRWVFYSVKLDLGTDRDPFYPSAVSPDLNKVPIPGVKNVIAVGAGKGGVGKTTVAVNLALALAKTGSRVGIIDGDIYGPNVPIMLGVKSQLGSDGDKIVPAEKYDLQVVSMGFLTTDDAPVIWRGPMLHGVIRQFFREVRWNNLDYLVVDLPPGTGDVVLSLSQTVFVAGAIVVTTPQQVSLSDTRRAIAMYQKLSIPILGLIENMSHFVCPSCRHQSDIFGSGGGERLAGEMQVPFLGRVPISEPLRVGGDTGVPIVLSDPMSAAAVAFIAAAERAAAQVSIQSFRKAPLIPLRQVN